MNKPIDPNLNDDLELDILNNTDDLSNPENTVKSTNDTDGTPSLSLNEEDKHRHSSGHHHHSHHHSSGSHHSEHHKHHSHSHHKKKKQKLPTAAKIAIAFLVLLLVVVIGIVGTFLFIEQKGKNSFTNVTTQTNYEEVIEHEGHKYVYNKDVVAIAFIGVDKRELGTDDAIGTAGQADADIVLTVDTKTGRAKAISIPRDTMVDVDLYSENNIFLRNENMQLCLSFAYGDGKASSANNVTTSISRILYNVPINKYFVLDLDGIAPINDAIGGVTVESLYNFENLGIKVGDKVHLTGNLTESYVRQRDMQTIDASLNRTARQTQYIKAFANQLVPAVLNDFSIVSRLYNTAADYSTTNLDLSNVTYLASLLVSKGVRDFETETLQGEMKESERTDYADYVYAEFYPDEELTLETVLDTFYTQVD
mgnify:FL=1